ncbi:ABC transporter ATP-binding protein [Geobacter sp. DSM 9736]|uniref:ABC transporter ATP-binding protein n=1 Tax=Geobacter sp. DSM 9736 TaxID=1277350 RepID=UPI000B50F773|nr:ABC transporter ATP-binding protein [Geobacter sp. DSM 9736]SNB47184.1 ATP-binding cassette, subfamily B [Geobacter sp. DSM 9736]
MHFGGLYEEEIVGKAYDRKLVARFLSYLRPYRSMVVLALLLLPLLAAARLAQPYLLKITVDRHLVTGVFDGLPVLALWFFILLLVESLFTYLQVYLLQLIGQRVMRDLRMELFSHVQRLPASFFDRTPTGGLVTRLTSDIEALGEMFAAGIITIIGDVVLLAGIIGIMVWMNLKLSLVTFSVLPLLFWVAFTFRRLMRQAFREVRSRLANLNSFLAESIGGIATVQLFNRQEIERNEFCRLNAAYRDSNLPVITWDASLYALVEALSSVAVGLIIWYGGNEILGGALSFGALVAFIYYIDKFFAPIRDLSAKYSVMQGAMAALERIFHLLDTEVDAGRNSLSIGLQSPGGYAEDRDQHPLDSVVFDNVWFAYSGNEYVLKGFNLKLRRGERIALVGETGGGKTTVTRLLTRLYEVHEGKIALNGTDIRGYSLSDLRRRIGIVLQEPYLFTGTVADNITLGDERARARMELAAALVGADRFIKDLPKGFDEEVRERGKNFSAGERQLISFARAVAYDPEILVLDEATASVDSASEKLIQEGLKGLMAGRTSLIVAHRLSTIQDADRIVVVHRGEKAEEGTHQELLAKRGLYYRLYELQFRG